MGRCLPVTFHNEVAARYTALPIFLIEAALIVGLDHALRRRRRPRLAARGPASGRRRWRCGPLLAVTALVAFLAVNWVADFRYDGIRSGAAAHPWAPVAAEWRA